MLPSTAGGQARSVFSRFRAGQIQCECGDVLVRNCLDTTTMGLNNGTDNGQSKSGTLALTCSGRICTVKTIKYSWQVFSRDRGAGVDHTQRCGVIRSCTQVNPYPFTCRC